MIKNIFSYYSPTTPLLYVYMLQQVDYEVRKFGSWLRRAPTMRAVQKRGKLDYTARAKLIVMASYTGWLLVGITAIGLAITANVYAWLLLLLLMPVGSLLAATLTSVLTQSLVNKTFTKEITLAQKKLEAMPATRVAILGSYGKTTMKELLSTVLSEGLSVAATPANKNVLFSHAKWVRSLAGTENVLLFEYGESRPGDIAKLASFSQPDIAVITGVAPAHMDTYESIDAIAQDFATITEYTDNPPLINEDATELHSYISVFESYGSTRAGKWIIKDVSCSINGTSFTMTHENKKLIVNSMLIGKHLVGPLAAVAAIADGLGLPKAVIERGLAKTKPFAHRMQPYRLSGAWIIDDTYNGNIEGMRAGLKLLRSLDANKKIYVTPGLVEQGKETEAIHAELGTLIALAQPDQVVLMNNSVRKYIQDALERAGFKGSITIIDNPLSYYENLQYSVSSGDIVLMQNDWPDGYS